MKNARFILTAVLLVNLLSGAAFATTKEVQTTQVTQTLKDARGTVLGEDTRFFNADGEQAGTQEVRYSYDDTKRLVESKIARYDAEDLLLYRMQTHWEYPKGEVFRTGKRVHYNGFDEVTQVELITWRRDATHPITTIETKVLNPDETLKETRYVVTESSSTGRTLNRDISVYDADDIQIRRTYERWRYTENGRIDRIQRFTFDHFDELSQKETEEWTFDGRGHLKSILTTTEDGQGESLGSREESRTLRPDGTLNERRIVYFNSAGFEEREFLESWVYDASGSLKTRRSSWFEYGPPTRR